MAHAAEFLKSIGSLRTTCDFLPQKEVIALQGLSQDFYDRVMPSVMTKVVQPAESLVLERNRNEVCIGRWKRDTRALTQTRLFKIGDEAGDIP